MNILFVYSTTKTINRRTPLRRQEDIYLGISYISSVLKLKNHRTELVVLDKKRGNKNFRTVDNEIENVNPDIICFTAVFSEIEFINVIAKHVRSKYPGIFKIIGGIHVSLNPGEEYLEIYDAICISEGEYPMMELADKMQVNESYLNIPNFWFKNDGLILNNQPRPFIENISELPFPDREMWQKWILEPISRITILLGRGCPFHCSYCCNHKIRKIAGGTYVRLRDVGDIIQEMNELSLMYPSVNDYFLEIETCGVNLDWLIDLCNELDIFNRKFKVPKSFSTNLRVFPGIKYEPLFQSLKKANFKSVSIGLESGNERVRREILNRDYPNDIIRRVVNSAREHGIRIGIFNMIGIPGETYNEFLDTLSLNQELQPDWHATSIFFPYQGTRLYEKAFEMGVIPQKIDFSCERQKAILDLPGFTKQQIQRSFDSFHLEVYKKSKKRNLIKLIIYFIQKFLGHNFMADQKVNAIRLRAFFKQL